MKPGEPELTREQIIAIAVAGEHARLVRTYGEERAAEILRDKELGELVYDVDDEVA